MSNLALTMRPERLEDVLGNDSVKRAIQSFADRNMWPNVFLLIGPPGTGKTTLALIIAKMAGADESGLLEINASDSNGVEYARQLGDISASRPFTGQRRVIILNEGHQLTPAAQDSLKDPMEKNESIWIITTDRPEKIQPAIKSRASAATFQLKPLNRGQIAELVLKAAPSLASGTGVGLGDWFDSKGITSPREILGILDRHLAGIPLEDAVHGSEHEPLYSSVAKAIVAGDWAQTSGLLKNIKTADCRGMVAIVSAFLRSELLRVPVGVKGDGLAACLVGLDQTGFADGVAYGAVAGLFYKVCKVLGGR
jgi:energy-coupling factor transporter ATP-binding protein EcfA2